MSDKATADWWCPTCKELLGGGCVTYQECCDTCGTYLADCQPPENAGNIVDKLRALRDASEPGGHPQIDAHDKTVWSVRRDLAIELLADLGEE